MRVGLSIIICTHNGINRLKPVFESINNLNIPEQVNLEVILVDNASTDGLSGFLESMLNSKDWNFKLLIIYENKAGLNFARISGAIHSNYEWLLFCDDDNLLDVNYIFYWYECLLKHKNLGALGGRGVAITDNPVPAWFNAYSHSFAVGSQFKYSGFIPKGSSLYGAGLFILKSPILQLLEKGFNMIMSDRQSGKLTSGGDLEWCYLIQLSGLDLYYDDRMFFLHQLDANRLHWSYYLKLKDGIASGAGLLVPYHFIFRFGYKCEFLFILQYIRLTLISTFILFAVFLKILLSSKNKDEKQNLALIILKSKCNSFWVNYLKAYVHYKKLLINFSASL